MIEDNDHETFNLLKQYKKLKDTLSINLSHSGHQGIQKTKALMRSKVFFLGIDNAFENKITNCVPCQATGQSNPSSIVQPTKIPGKVWDAGNIDNLGPLPNGKYVLTMIDQRSRHPAIAGTTSISATKNIISNKKN